MTFDESGRMVAFGEFPRLETERLVLRRMTLDDAEFYLRHFSDPDIVELTAFEGPRDIEAARAELLAYCIENFDRNTGIRWGISLKPDPALIGTCGFHQWVKAGGYHARIGYDLAAAHRRKGIMTEALAAMIAYGFSEMRLHRIEALVDPRNVGSVRTLEKLGFRRDGVLREDMFFRGRFVDDAVYSLLEHEWRGRRTPAGP